MKIYNLLISQDLIPIITQHIAENYPKTKQELWLSRYYYIIDKIYITSSYYQDRGASLNMKNLSELFNIPSDKTSKIMKFLQDNNIIRCTKGYIVGVSSKQYKINSEYKKNIINISQKMELKETKKEYNDFLTNYFYNLKQISINIPLIILSDIEQMSIIKNIQNLSFNLVQPISNSRVYHSICNLKRENRKYLSWNNQNIYQSDIVASQVFLGLMMYINNSGISIEDQPQDIKNLYKILTNDDFYNIMMLETGHKDRNKFKQAFFKSVYFNKVEGMNNKISKTFEKLFPTMFNFIKDIKNRLGYEQFAIKLQAFEWGLIEDILKNLYNNNIPAINLHDAILFPENENKELINKIINDIYISKFNIKPIIKTDKF